MTKPDNMPPGDEDKDELDDVIFRYEANDGKPKEEGAAASPPWKIVIVDDEPTIHEATELALEDLEFEGKPVNFISAHSGKEARNLLAKHPDVAVILLDVVMEQNNSGLELARYIRETMQNRLTRIVLRTGQPGQAPERSVILAYDINDYKLKADLTQDRLTTTTIMALRGYQDLLALEAARTEVQSVNRRLEAEVRERRQIEAELRKHRDHLEKLVAERTAELEKALDAAKVANRAKSAFLANMNHELRSPLNAILGFSQLMGRSPDIPSEHRENIGIIRRSGEHLLTLINQVLDLSKIEAGQMTLDEEIFDLHALLEETEDMFRLRAGERQLWLRFEQTPDVPRHVRTDEVRLRQVLINLLANAVKFTREGGVSVRTEAQPHEGSAADAPYPVWSLRFEIEDTGPGIGPEESDMIFEPFIQTAAGQGRREGTGLGLPISRKFVRLMGGDISVRSPVFSSRRPAEGGPGSAFSFNIRAEGADESTMKERPPECHVVGLESGQPRYRILVADDRPDNRQLLVSLLSPLGFDVREAADGREAVDAWEAWRPHLIWMDLGMPVMDGCEAARQIRNAEKGKRTVIIAVSANAFEDERPHVLSAGCDDFLCKPFPDTDIFGLMHHHLGVRYVCAEDTGAGLTGYKTDDALNRLRAVSERWLAKLKQAAEETDPITANMVIQQIARQDELLARGLAELVENFRFDILQELLGESV